VECGGGGCNWPGCFHLDGSFMLTVGTPPSGGEELDIAVSAHLDAFLRVAA